MIGLPSIVSENYNYCLQISPTSQWQIASYAHNAAILVIHCFNVTHGGEASQLFANREVICSIPAGGSAEPPPPPISRQETRSWASRCHRRASSLMAGDDNDFTLQTDVKHNDHPEWQAGRTDLWWSLIRKWGVTRWTEAASLPTPMKNYYPFGENVTNLRILCEMDMALRAGSVPKVFTEMPNCDWCSKRSAKSLWAECAL